MAVDPVSVRASIDRAWLERAAHDDPLPHAYALWDLDRFPDRVRFYSAVRGEATTGYLLVWLGRLAVLVHWFGAVGEARELARELPPRPLVVVAPEGVRSVVEEARGPGRIHGVLTLLAPPGTGGERAPAAGPVRRLLGADRPALLELTEASSELVASGYPSVDLDREAVWGAFDGARLAGVARTTVTLPGIWVLSGVFVDPARRGAGFGRALVDAVLAEAARARVPVGLYVREDRPAARALYDRAGFRPHGRRLWIDAGAGLEP